MIQHKGPFDRVSQSYKLIDDWIFGKRHNKIPWQQICDWYLNFIGRQKVQTTSKRPTTYYCSTKIDEYSSKCVLSHFITLFPCFYGQQKQDPTTTRSLSVFHVKQGSIDSREGPKNWLMLVYTLKYPIDTDLLPGCFDQNQLGDFAWETDVLKIQYVFFLR